jgi:hypothetical protein
VDNIALAEQKLGQIGAVLSRRAGYESNFVGHSLLPARAAGWLARAGNIRHGDRNSPRPNREFFAANWGYTYAEQSGTLSQDGKTSTYQPSVPSDLGGLKCCASFGRGLNFASISEPTHFIFAV